MPETSSQRLLLAKLSTLYVEMEEAYDRIASQLGLSCENCSQNCCTSYFLHHTYIEWAYLWEGIKACNEEKQNGFLHKAEAYVREAESLLAKGLHPEILCPLNEDGLCRLYTHRLMICRMHGDPNSFFQPDGKKLRFPGCKTCQEGYADSTNVPVLDRTDFYRRLAELERQYLEQEARPLPRVKLTLAEMLVNGPPQSRIGISG